jgi:hypothetical protein
MWLNPVNIQGRDLPDAWFQAIDAVLDHGRQWTVQHGSFEGQKRWELDWVTVHITHPGTRPIIPEMPEHLSKIPPPTTMDYVEEYLPYLMTDQPLKENEQYTYGQRIVLQMDKIIRRYKTHGYGSNQECIAVARPEDIDPQGGRALSAPLLPVLPLLGPLGRLPAESCRHQAHAGVHGCRDRCGAWRNPLHLEGPASL